MLRPDDRSILSGRYRTWQPRYLCFATARDLPRIAVAALTAEAFRPTRRAAPTVAEFALTTS